jgi:hypothetical protein
MRKHLKQKGRSGRVEEAGVKIERAKRELESKFFSFSTFFFLCFFFFFFFFP